MNKYIIIPRLDRLDEVSSPLYKEDIYNLVSNKKTIDRIKLKQRESYIEACHYGFEIDVNNFALLSGIVLKEDSYQELIYLYDFLERSKDKTDQKLLQAAISREIVNNKLNDIVPVKYDSNELYNCKSENFYVDNESLNLTGLVLFDSFINTMKKDNYKITVNNYNQYIHDLCIGVDYEKGFNQFIDFSK